ncbi:MAG TPA: L-histidine N(alpha)-methyltransferase [Thermoplasmataceae archaeon]|nr:L-histidine N(alpha)-methyltransferase [Thermoplasmatales archaeon AK]HLH85747.1 L-histidine N(alpha)-methyltransferase [Thermoplasmataceae archaeon]
MQLQESYEIIDLKPRASDFRKEVRESLLSEHKWISPKFFYDRTGSELFEEITKLDEYYPTRAEMEILASKAGEIGRAIGEGVSLAELGSGNGKKSVLLAKALPNPKEAILVDISMDALLDAMKRFKAECPSIPAKAVCADYTAVDAMSSIKMSGRKAIVFLGSTIGNMEPADQRSFIAGCRKVLCRGETLTIGADLKKDPEVIERAYNDRKGITARFNLNLIARINREFGIDIPPDAFRHYAFYNSEEGRVEMHLVSTRNQSYNIGGITIRFREGESIHTENSYKFTTGDLKKMLVGAGFSETHVWKDSRDLYALITAVV